MKSVAAMRPRGATAALLIAAILGLGIAPRQVRGQTTTTTTATTTAAPQALHGPQALLGAQALRGWLVAGEFFAQQVQAGPVVLYNMTRGTRAYGAHTCGDINPDGHYACYDGPSFALPAGGLCRLDNVVYHGDVWRNNRRHPGSSDLNYVEDRSDGDTGSFNSVYITGNDNFDSCANEGINACAGSRWGSWMVGMMASRVIDAAQPRAAMDGGVEYWVENNWGSGNAIDYTHAWREIAIALIMTQGSTDGNPFDIRANNGYVLPTLEQVFTAPLCAQSIATRS